MKTLPIRILINGKPKLYKPIGAKFYILFTKNFRGERIALVYVPRWYKQDKKGNVKIDRKGIVEYVFVGTEVMS